MNPIDKFAQQETAQLNQVKPLSDKNFDSYGGHSRPIPKEPEDVRQARQIEEQTLRGSRERPLAIGSNPGPTPPASIYQEMTGGTLLSDTLNVRDNHQTYMLDQYILQKMNVGKLQDTKENYEKVLHTLMSKNRINLSQDRNYVLNKLYLYLSGKDLDNEDDLVISILTKKGVRLYGRDRKYR